MVHGSMWLLTGVLGHIAVQPTEHDITVVLELFGRTTLRRPFRKRERHARRVAVQHGHARTGAGDLEVGGFLERGGVPVDAAQDLARFALQLVFFAGDVRDDVVEDVHAADARVPGARESLERDHGAFFDRAEFCLEGGEGDHEADDGAVGVADLEALLEAPFFTLVGDEGQMREVHGRDHEGHKWMASVVLCIGEEWDVGFDECELCRVAVLVS
nr:hypothetical protein CFP56_73760 [Quercus suber]